MLAVRQKPAIFLHERIKEIAYEKVLGLSLFLSQVSI
jgi:hypothetical protein